MVRNFVILSSYGLHNPRNIQKVMCAAACCNLGVSLQIDERVLGARLRRPRLNIDSDGEAVDAAAFHGDFSSVQGVTKGWSLKHELREN